MQEKGISYVFQHSELGMYLGGKSVLKRSEITFFNLNI